MPSRLASLALVSLLALVQLLPAQSVELVVRESATHALVPGAIVRLLKEDTVAHPPPDFAKDFDIPALKSIEVHRSAAETPGEFSGSGAGCGTIVLWSRRRN